MSRPRQPRPRIRDRDAHLVRARVEARAAALGLRCGTLLVLTAVLALLLGWKRVRDDEVAIRHVAVRFPPGTRPLSAATIGRRLARLADLGLIVYRPARGRGRGASIAIHPQFLEGVSELARDSRGRVVLDGDTPSQRAVIQVRKRGENVKFSHLGLLIGDLSPSTSQPSAPNGDVREAVATRPVEVAVSPHEVRGVLAQLPDWYRSAPAWVRWKIGAAVKTKLAKGWREDQILAILSAPAPAEVRKPLLLVRWRLTQNMPGVGPRLQPLQRAWDAAHAAAERARVTNQRDRDYARIRAELGPFMTRRMAECAHDIAASQAGRWSQPATSAQQQSCTAAVVHAARMARRENPGTPLREAVRSWLAAHQTKPSRPAAAAQRVPGPSLTVADLIAATPAGRCVSCASVAGVTRNELPLPAPVCEDCWSYLGDPADDRGDDPQIGRPAASTQNNYRREESEHHVAQPVTSPRMADRDAHRALPQLACPHRRLRNPGRGHVLVRD